jgi:hypothetical protein
VLPDSTLTLVWGLPTEVSKEKVFLEGTDVMIRAVRARKVELALAE